MNTNQVKGAVKDVAGTVQRKAGELTGSTSQQVKGAAREIAGKVQKGVGDAQQAVEDSKTSTAHKRP